MTFSGITTFFATLWGWIIGGFRFLYRVSLGQWRFLFSAFYSLGSFLGTGYIVLNFLRLGAAHWQDWIDKLRSIADGTVTSTLPGAGALSGLVINASYIFRFDLLATGMGVLLSLWVSLAVWRLMRALRRGI